MTMALVASTLSGSLSLTPVDEKSWFHIPGIHDFRFQRLANSGHEKDWPFAVASGTLLCAYVTGRPIVYFTDVSGPDDAEKAPRIAMVSTNPLDLGLGNMGADGLVRRDMPMESLIAAMGPFEAMGQRLCDQPAGASIGPGEL